MSDQIADRLLRYFSRQISWLKERQDFLQELQPPIPEDALEQYAAAQSKHDAELQHFLREQQGLLREWQGATKVSEADRTAVRARAEEADELLNQVMKLNDRVRHEVEKQMRDLKAEQQSLHRGRGATRRYSSGTGDAPDVLDRRA